MAYAGASPLPNLRPKHRSSSLRFFSFEFAYSDSFPNLPSSKCPCQAQKWKQSYSVRTNVVYTEASCAPAAAPWKEKGDSPSDVDDISILNERIRKELGKRHGLRSGSNIVQSANAEEYIKTLKQQQKIGLLKLKGNAHEKGGFGYRVDPYSLQPGDYVVHRKVGIGRFVEIKYDVSKGSSESSEYVFIEYADGMAKLPVKQAYRMLYRYNL